MFTVSREQPISKGRLPRTAARIRILAGPEIGVWVLARHAGLDDSSGPWARADGVPPEERMTYDHADALNIIGRVIVLVDESVD